MIIIGDFIYGNNSTLPIGELVWTCTASPTVRLYKERLIACRR